MVGFVLELVKSASLDRLHRLFLLAGVRNGLLVWLSCILIFLSLIFVYLFGRARSILWARDRDAFGFESRFNGWEVFQEGGKLLDVERDSLQLLLAFAMPVALAILNEDPPSFLEASLPPSRRTRGYQLAACP